MPACMPVKEKIPKSSNENGKYGAVLFSPGWTGTVTHQKTEMSSAQFAAGHVFYKHFPLVVSRFSYNNTFLTIEIGSVQHIHV